MWVTTDKNGDKFIFDKKPERLENVWDSDCDSDDLDKLVSEVFPKTSKALDEEDFIIDNIEIFDI